ncbi:transposase [Candidatus Poriferisodalis sp.]|uniref:transposase n=1 Tax=Candidatus Poriferisodalis sp. TaxID=3101277 RepID=UPI003AF85645
MAAYVGLVAQHRRHRRCRVLLVDETSIRERHRYVTVLVNGDTGEVARHGAPPQRSSSEVHSRCPGAQMVPGREGRGVRGVQGMQGSLDEQLGHARHVLDRFHVIRWFAAVRRDVQRRKPEGVKPVFEPKGFRARCLLMARPDMLDAAEHAHLEELFDKHPRLRAAWETLGEPHGLYLAQDRKSALDALDRFANIYGLGQIPEFSDTVDTFLPTGWCAPPTGPNPTDRFQGTKPAKTQVRPAPVGNALSL